MDNKKPLTLYELQQRELREEFAKKMLSKMANLRPAQIKTLFNLSTEDSEEQKMELFAIFKKNKREERNKMWRPPIRKKRGPKATPSVRSSLQK